MREGCFLVVLKQLENSCGVKPDGVQQTVAAGGFCSVPKYMGPRTRVSALPEDSGEQAACVLGLEAPGRALGGTTHETAAVVVLFPFLRDTFHLGTVIARPVLALTK